MDQMNIGTCLTKNHAEYEDMIKAAFGLRIERTSVPTADHRLASASIALELKDRAQLAAATTLTTALFTVTHDKAQNTFAVVAPSEITDYFKVNAEAIGAFNIHSDLCVYKVTIQDYDTKLNKLQNKTINWGWIYPPHGTTDSKSDIQSKLQTLGNKTDIKITQVVQTKDKLSGMTEAKFRFEFEVGNNFSPFGLHKFAKITLSAGESKVLLNPEVCENYGVHRECLKLLNGRSGTMNLTADMYCSCSLARSTGGPSTKAQTSAAQVAFADRHKKRKANAIDPFA